MGIVLDVILIVIILLNVIICYKKGLVKLAVGLVAVIVSLILAIILYKPVTNIIIKNTEIDEKIKESIINTLTTESNENDTSDKGMMQYMQSYVDDAVNKTKNEIVIEASEVVSTKIINVCAFLGIFVVVRILAILLTIIADLIMSLPILKQFNKVNKAGGIIYGILKALIIIYIILAIIFAITYITGNTTISNVISETYITKIFYNNNVLLNFIFKK